MQHERSESADDHAAAAHPRLRSQWISMPNAPEKILILDPDPHSSEDLRAALQSAGYDVAVFATTREGLDAIHQTGADIVLLDAAAQEPGAGEVLATIRGSAKTAAMRVLLLVAGGSEQRASAMDLGANDAISRPYDSRELLARVRACLRVQRAENELREKMRIAEEGQQIAHTAFEALAVTEKMTSDAFSLDRKLKTGLAAVLAVAILMAGIYLLFARSAQKVTQRSNSILAKLEGGIVRQQDLIAEARKLRAQQGIEPGAAAVEPVAKDDLKKQAEDLKAKMATANSDDAAGLQKQFAPATPRSARPGRAKHHSSGRPIRLPAARGRGVQRPAIRAPPALRWPQRAGRAHSG